MNEPEACKMNGIGSQCPSISIFPYNDLKPPISSTKLLWLSKFSKYEPATCGFLCMHKRNRVFWFPTRVTSAPLFLAATSPPPNSGDFSVLFQTSAVMLLMYWIANFVVPWWVLKDLEVDKTNDERKRDRENSSDNR
nr:uncharacterized protein LOC113688055 [Coffea arabica]XP_027061526.1 uncharacterized protein LOC113688079 [Coffea arabica]